MSARAEGGKRARAPAAMAVTLPAVMDHAAARPLALALMAARDQDLDVDASGVTHLGAQCAQVLLSSRRTWAAGSRRLRIVAPGDGFVEGLRLLGLSSELGE